jgi:ribosomal protein S18 acetylase RimI-like enzyme
VSGAGLIVRPMIPRPGTSGGIEVRETQVVNVYTEVAWRRRGIAALVMRQLLDYTSANKLNRVSLHASDDGRPLYESLGFEPTNEMRLAPPAE